MPDFTDSYPYAYPLYRVSGLPRELGRQHGEQARQQIRAFADYLAKSLELSAARLEQRALCFLPLFERYVPDLLEEIAGLSQGAGIPFAQALAAQIRGELAGVVDEACTTFAVAPHGTATGELLIGQTSDTPAEIEEFAYVLQLDPVDRPKMLMWTFGGMLGYHGINEHGVSHFANSLGGGPGWKFALPHYPLKRRLLECRSTDEVEETFRRLPVCSNGNYMLAADRSRILDVELTTEGPHFLRDEGPGLLVHSNHFLCGAVACEATLAASLPDSVPRLDRLQELMTGQFGSLSVDNLQRMLSDHSGHPTGICRHPHHGSGNEVLPSTGKTVAAIIAEPTVGRMHVAKGNPCEHAFVTYTLLD